MSGDLVLPIKTRRKIASIIRDNINIIDVMDEIVKYFENKGDRFHALMLTDMILTILCFPFNRNDGIIQNYVKQRIEFLEKQFKSDCVSKPSIVKSNSNKHVSFQLS